LRSGDYRCIATYISSFTNTPAAGDNNEGAEREPVIPTGILPYSP
jgi:hypothetical protein